jgi:hypothetical protein
VPVTRRETVLTILAEGYEERLAASDPSTAARWFARESLQLVWPVARPAAGAVLLAFLVNGGLGVPWPVSSARLARAWPEGLLLLAAAWAGWRARSPWTGPILGLATSALVTVGFQAAYIAALAIGQWQLFKLGLTWASLRDLASILLTSVTAGTLVASIGGCGGALAGARAARGRS